MVCPHHMLEVIFSAAKQRAVRASKDQKGRCGAPNRDKNKRVPGSIKGALVEPTAPLYFGSMTLAAGETTMAASLEGDSDTAPANEEGGSGAKAACDACKMAFNACEAL